MIKVFSFAKFDGFLVGFIFKEIGYLVFYLFNNLEIFRLKVYENEKLQEKEGGECLFIIYVFKFVVCSKGNRVNFYMCIVFEFWLVFYFFQIFVVLNCYGFEQVQYRIVCY